MIYLKQTVRGIDVPIQQLQNSLYQELCFKWELRDKDYNSYGRCYRNQRETGYAAEVFKGGTEYIEVMGDDKVHVQSFFGISGDRSVNPDQSSTAQVHFIMMVNLTKVVKLPHRGDEEVRLDVYEILKRGFCGFEPTEIVTGIERVFEDYPGSRDGLKHRDMHPYHYFRINGEMTFDPRQTLHIGTETTNNFPT